MERKDIRDTVFRQTMYYTKLRDFQKMLSDILAEISVEYRKEVFIDFEIEDDYGSYNNIVEIYYWRPETDEELADRIRKENTQEIIEKNKKRELLLKLKKEFEDE